jgi:hypothetical protein
MIVTYLYVGFRYKTDTGYIDVAPFLVIPSGTYNGKNQYTFYYTINGNSFTFLIQWSGTTWVLLNITPSGIVATIPALYSNNEFPGITSSVNWEITLNPEYPTDISEFYTYLVEETIPDNTVEACTYWYSENNIEFPLPWQDKVWYLYSNGEGIFVGQTITNVTFDNGTPVFEGTGVYHIGAILYSNNDGTTFSTTYSTIFSEFVGIIVMDSNNNFVLPIPAEESYNQGTICLAYPIPPTEADLEIECFQKAVWSKQCQYSNAVDNYRQAMIFSSVCCDMLENLKQQRRILHILNCYDTKDIPNNTTLYNTFTYTQIQQLLTL